MQVYSFLKQHPDMSARTPENFGYQREYMTEENVRDLFEKLRIFLQEEHNIDAKEFLSESNSTRIFNLDESGFPLQGTNGRMKDMPVKGAKSVHNLTPDS